MAISPDIRRMYILQSSTPLGYVLVSLSNWPKDEAGNQELRSHLSKVLEGEVKDVAILCSSEDHIPLSLAPVISTSSKDFIEGNGCIVWVGEPARGLMELTEGAALTSTLDEADDYLAMDELQRTLEQEDDDDFEDESK